MSASGGREEDPAPGGAAPAVLPANVGTRLLPARQFWLAWTVLAVLTVAFSIAARLEGHFPGDVRIARAVQGITVPVVGGLLHIENTIGSPWPAVAIITVFTVGLVLARRLRLALLFLSINLLRGVGSVVKGAVDRPRPDSSLVHVFGHSSGASFPSGHVFSAVLLYGTLAVLAQIMPLPRLVRRGVQTLCLLIVLFMGPARVYVGAHWPSDVLGGYLWGLLMLLLALEVGSRWIPALVWKARGP